MKKLWKMVCSMLLILCVSIGSVVTVSADTSGGLTNRIDMQKKYADDFYGEGMYKVGVDMPAGEYMVFASSGSGYYCRSTDSNQDDIIENENFDYNGIIAVNDGEYMDLSRCYAIPIDKVSNDDIDLTGTGTFKAGLHFAAGEYKLTADPGKSGYYSIFNERNNCKIVTNDLFEGNSYVTVYDGQYLTLSRCYFDPAPAKLEKVYTDAETIKTVQEALNAAGYDCGTPDGSAGPQTTSMILQYQKDHALPESGTVSESLVRSLLGGEESGGTDDTKVLITSEEPAITWMQLARTPDDYMGEEVTFVGEVVQVMNGDGYTQFRLAVEGDYDTILFCEIQDSALSMRLLDRDIVEVHGISIGLVTYDTIMGGSVTIPAILADSATVFE